MNCKYDHVAIAFMREEEGLSWPEIAGRLGAEPTNIRQSHHKWKQRRENGVPEEPRLVQEWRKEAGGTFHYKYPEPPVDEEAVKKLWDGLLSDIRKWKPRQSPPKLVKPKLTDPVIAVPNLYDAHFGMHAWGEELDGEDQDLDIISDDWRRAVDHLVGMAQMYPVERWMCPLGHDLSHIDHMEQGKVGVTKAGTVQDFDTRLPKIFRGICNASIYLIDALRSVAPVDVVMVPGNHDRDINNYLGCVMEAWYRSDKLVSFDASPKPRKYYGYGRNAWMLYHGELYTKRKAGNPLLIFATECPAKLWVASEGGSREVLSGHFHKRQQGRYTPTADIDEERGIIARSLPGLTATDQWHHAMGYHHKRAATLLVYKKSGGLHALHEFQP